MVAIDEDDPTAAYILGRLEAYRLVRTPFVDERPDGDRQIYLSHGDHVCGECDDLVDPAGYGEGAPLIPILGRQRLKYGQTYCSGCLVGVQN